MKNFTPIRDVLTKILKRKRICDDIKSLKLFTEWEKIVGERFARYAHPIRVKKNVLYVEIEDPAYLSHMEYIKANLIEKISKATGKMICDIKFTLSE
ncbi:MAG: DUF721 domain-containing protein [Desulfobacterota bacterium]|nr:DUF721 domain-containing protein [Thermodesulfobacteriota bacterium]MDW8001832.1 DUF721 domain-containing protein [Deltaproteobacteria bacterium]